MFSFGRKEEPKDPKDELRENRRDLRKSQRELDRERSRLQREKRQIEQDIRKASRDGQQGAVRTMAKRLIQVRKQEERLLGSKAQLSSMDTNMVSAHANYTVGKTMGNAAEIMKKQNNTMQHQITAKNAQDFARVSEQSKMTEEMMDDALGDIFDEDEDEEDEVVSQVLGEIGIAASSKLPEAGKSTPAGRTQNSSEKEASDAEVDALLKELESA